MSDVALAKADLAEISHYDVIPSLREALSGKVQISHLREALQWAGADIPNYEMSSRTSTILAMER